MMASMNRIVGYLIVFNLVWASTYSPFVAEIGVYHLISGVLTLITILIAVFKVAYWGVIKKKEGVSIVLTLYLIIQSVIYFVSGVPFGDVIRAYISFIYMPVFVFLCLDLKPKYSLMVLKSVLFVGGGVSLLVVPFFYELLIVKSLNYSRFTAYFDLTHTPILILTIPLVYLLKPNRKIIYLSIILVSIFATQSKGQILFGVLALVMCEFVGKKINIRMLVKLIFILVLLSSPFLVFTDTLSKRFSDIQGSTSMHRVEEILIASGYFVNNLAIGNGPGTVFSVDNVANSEINAEQTYIHNVVFYMLATGGIIGLFFYFLPFYQLFQIKYKSDEVRYLLIAVYFSFFYLLVSASFKSIQTNMFLGVLIGVALNYASNQRLYVNKEN